MEMTLPFGDPAPVPVAFDYGTMAADVAQEARAAVERYRGRSRSYVMDTGRDLLAMKERLEHGLFLRWVEAEMGLQPRTAQNFMQAADRFAGKSEIVSHLPPGAIYQLSAPSTPEPVREEVVRRLEAGERLNGSAVVGMVQAAKVNARQKAAEAREAARRGAMSDEQRAAEDKTKLSRAQRKAAREAKLQRENEEAKKRAEVRTKARHEAVALLVDRMGGDLKRFVELARASDGLYWIIAEATEAMEAAS